MRVNVFCASRGSRRGDWRPVRHSPAPWRREIEARRVRLRALVIGENTVKLEGNEKLDGDVEI